MSSIKKIKVYLIATEPSGDVIGSNLIKSLKKVNKNKVQFFVTLIQLWSILFNINPAMAKLKTREKPI